MEIAGAILALSLGLGLSAACGFRVFMPPLFVGIAMRSEWAGLTSGGDWGWMAADAALVVMAVATVAELGAYYIPWLDNLLDSIASPAAVIAGILMTGVALDGTSPMLQWSLAVIAGGGLAGTVQVGTVATRAFSTMSTGGLANPVVSTAEAGACVVCTVLAVFLPLLALAAAIALAVLGVKMIVDRRAKAQATPEAAPSNA